MDDLTPRQAQVLALCAQGGNRNEIAARLCLSPWTIDNVFKAARQTLQAATNTQAVVIAIARGDLVLDSSGYVTTPHRLHEIFQAA